MKVRFFDAATRGEPFGEFERMVEVSDGHFTLELEIDAAKWAERQTPPCLATMMAADPAARLFLTLSGISFRAAS